MRFLHRNAEHNLCGQLNQVDLQHFTYEGETSTCTKVTFDNLNLVVSCQVLDIERTADV